MLQAPLASHCEVQGLHILHTNQCKERANRSRLHTDALRSSACGGSEHVHWCKRSPAHGLWMLCSRSSTSALEAYLAALNAWAVSAKTKRACLVIYIFAQRQRVDFMQCLRSCCIHLSGCRPYKKKQSTSWQPLPTSNKVTLLRQRLHGKCQSSRSPACCRCSNKHPRVSGPTSPSPSSSQSSRVGFV